MKTFPLIILILIVIDQIPAASTTAGQYTVYVLYRQPTVWKMQPFWLLQNNYTHFVLCPTSKWSVINEYNASACFTNHQRCGRWLMHWIHRSHGLQWKTFRQLKTWRDLKVCAGRCICAIKTITNNNLERGQHLCYLSPIITLLPPPLLTSLLFSTSDSLLKSSVFRFSKSDSPTAIGTQTVRLGLWMKDM